MGSGTFRARFYEFVMALPVRHTAAITGGEKKYKFIPGANSRQNARKCRDKCRSPNMPAKSVQCSTRVRYRWRRVKRPQKCWLESDKIGTRLKKQKSMPDKRDFRPPALVYGPRSPKKRSSTRRAAVFSPTSDRRLRPGSRLESFSRIANRLFPGAFKLKSLVV